MILAQVLREENKNAVRMPCTEIARRYQHYWYYRQKGYSDGQSLRTYFGKKSEYYCFFYVLSLALRTSKTIHLERPNIKIHHLERTGDLTLRTCLGH